MKNMPVSCVSFDNKYFFKTTGKNLVVELHQEKTKIVPINYDYIHQYTITDWLQAKHTPTYDIYIEKTKLEMDYEIIPLVNALNLYDGIETTGSCCGHNVHEPFVMCICTNIEIVQYIKHLCSNTKLFNISTLHKIDKERYFINIIGEHIGQIAYQDILDFTNDIEQDYFKHEKK